MKLYEEAAKAQQAGEAGAGEPAQDDNVVDAEYTEVNEEEKNKKCPNRDTDILGSISASIVKKSKSGYLDFGFFTVNGNLLQSLMGNRGILEKNVCKLGLAMPFAKMC